MKKYYVAFISSYEHPLIEEMYDFCHADSLEAAVKHFELRFRFAGKSFTLDRNQFDLYRVRMYLTVREIQVKEGDDPELW